MVLLGADTAHSTFVQQPGLETGATLIDVKELVRQLGRAGDGSAPRPQRAESVAAAMIWAGSRLAGMCGAHHGGHHDGPQSVVQFVLGAAGGRLEHGLLDLVRRDRRCGVRALTTERLCL
eukprot:COSAG01_NODE_1081_length_11817_cov_3.279911_10_plen_120_part_00